MCTSFIWALTRMREEVCLHFSITVFFLFFFFFQISLSFEIGKSSQRFLTHYQSTPSKLKKVSTIPLDYQVFLGVFHPYCSINRLTHNNQFQIHNCNQYRHQCQLPLSKNKQDLSASPANRVSPSQQISLHKSLSGLLT